MSRDDEKLLRQLSLVSLLLARRRPVTTREIRQVAEGYASMTDQAFARRFYDDREDLRRSGIVVESTSPDEDGELYFLPAENYSLPDLHFTPGETQALSLALALLQGRFAYARPLRLALASLTRGHPDPLLDESDRVAVALAPDDEAERWGDKLSQLDDAVVRGKTVVFPYRTAANVEGQRTLDPYALVRIGGHWYVVGRDHGHDDMRMFRLSRVTGPLRYATKKPRDFTTPPDFDPSEYRARPPWLIGAETGIARLRVADDLAWWVTRSYPCVGVEHVDASGHAVLRTPYADGSALVAWVIGLGGRAEIVAPDDLRVAALAALKAVRDAHITPAGPLPLAPPPGNAPPLRPKAAEASPIRPERLPRMLALLSYLMDPDNGKRVPLADIRRDLGLSRTETQADLSLLNLVNHGGGTYLLNAEIDGDAVVVDREPGGEAMAGPARLSPLMARALLLALDVVGPALPSETRADLDSVRTNVEASLGGAALPGSIEMGDLVPADSDIVGTLNRALRDRLVVRLRYYTPSREVLTERRVEPSLLYHSGDAWYLEAYCLQAGGQRTFRLDLIRSAVAAGDTFETRPEMDLTAHHAGPLDVTRPRASLAWVRFPRHQQHLLEEQGFDVVVEDDSATARIPYFDERWLIREVMRHGGDAELLEPGSLRERIAAAAVDLMSRYAASVEPNIVTSDTFAATPQREDT
jgi:predicted DNA-binding transcriptional regulator YafY